MQEATALRPEIWIQTSWHPAFVKTVKSYQALMCSTQSPEESQASMNSCLISLIALDLRKTFAGKLAYGAYVDDVLLEQFTHIPEPNFECLPPEDQGLCKTFLAGVFPQSKWVACLCCAGM